MENGFTANAYRTALNVVLRRILKISHLIAPNAEREWRIANERNMRKLQIQQADI